MRLKIMILCKTKYILVLMCITLLAGCAEPPKPPLTDPGTTSIDNEIIPPVNNAPIANAGIDKSVASNTLVTLSASGSMDPDDDVLSHLWIIMQKPATSTSSLNDTETESANFTPDAPGEYHIKVVVSDGKAFSEDNVIITAMPPPNQVDTVSPTTPTNLVPTNLQASQVTLSWTTSSDNTAVVGYRIYRNNQLLGTTSDNSYIDQTVIKNSSYTYSIIAFDATNNESSNSLELAISTPSSNISFKSFPSQVNLQWTDTNNSNGTTNYAIYRDNIKIASTKMLTYQDRLLTPVTNYNYQIKIIDTNNQESNLPAGNITAQTTKRRMAIQVYETAGIDIADHNVSVFIPLPYGVYTQSESDLANTFVLKNKLNQSIPSQYWVRSRWHARDNSIKEMVVVFKASVNANSISEYYLEEGVSSTPTAPVVVTNNLTDIVVSNSNVSFTLNKTKFNFLDRVSYKGKEIINNTTNDGAYIVNRFNKIYRDADDCTTANNTQASLTPLIFEVEEAGPVRARIRVERPAYVVQDNNDPCFSNFKEAKDPVPGFVVWFDLNYDSNEIVVNYNLLNNAITPYRNGQKGDGLTGWPLFYQEAGITLRTTLVNPTTEVSTDSSTLIFSGKVIQEAENILTMNGNSIASKGGTLKVSDASGYGFALIDPFFDKSFPNGWDFDLSNNLTTFLTSPDDCTSCEGFSETTTASSSGLYALNDLSVQEKRFIIRLFDNINTPALNTELLKNHTPPVAVLSVKDYSSIGTSTDMFGISQPFVEKTSSLDNTYSNSKYRAHQQTFGIDFSRYRSCTTGGIPTTAMDHMIARPPRINQMAVDIYDDIKRPQVLPRYWSGLTTPTKYLAMKSSSDISGGINATQAHHSTEFSSSGYCKNEPIRAFFGNNDSTYDNTKIFPSGYSGAMTAYPRDNQHLWMQQLADAPVDNPMLEYFKRSYEQYLQGYAGQLAARHTAPEDIYESVGDYWVEDHVRAIGNSLISLVDYYLESGNSDSLTAIETILNVILFRQNINGGINTSVSFQDGYMITSVLNAMSSVSDKHPIYKKGWSYLYGGGERQGLPGILDAQLTIDFGYYDIIGCKDNNTPPCKLSDGTATSNIDPTTIAAYLLATKPSPYTGTTDETRANLIMNHLIEYLDGVNGSGPYFIGNNWRTDIWDGSLVGRSQNLINYFSTQPSIHWGGAISHKEGLSN